MNEREDHIDEQVDALQYVINRVHEDIRLEAIWDPSTVNPEIPLNDQELDDFVKSFSNDEKGAQLADWIRLGSLCEAIKVEGEKSLRCENRAVATVDWSGVMIADSVLTCRQDLRYVYKDIMDNAVRKQGIYPSLTINGKQVPKALK